MKEYDLFTNHNNVDGLFRENFPTLYNCKDILLIPTAEFLLFLTTFLFLLQDGPNIIIG